MERTEIIKALELHSTGSVDDCKNCPYDRIELTDDETCADRMCLDTLQLIKELTEENLEWERRYKNTIRAELSVSNEIGEDFKKFKIDTVREMQEKVKAEAYVPKPYGMSKVVDVGTIDRIANEMLNKTEEEKK